MPYLIVQFQGGFSRRVEVEKSPTVLGRGTSCDVQIVDDKVSRRHCQLSELEGQWHLEDLDSRNQTWIGLEAIEQTLLADGDQFRIGQTQIVFRTEEDPTQAFEEPPSVD